MGTSDLVVGDALLIPACTGSNVWHLYKFNSEKITLAKLAWQFNMLWITFLIAPDKSLTMHLQCFLHLNCPCHMSIDKWSADSVLINFIVSSTTYRFLTKYLSCNNCYLEWQDFLSFPPLFVLLSVLLSPVGHNPVNSLYTMISTHPFPDIPSMHPYSGDWLGT